MAARMATGRLRSAMTDIQGKRVLVTGAASGLGEMLATELARAGANLVLWDIDETGPAIEWHIEPKQNLPWTSAPGGQRQ